MNFDFQYRKVNSYVKLNFRINLSTGFFYFLFFVVANQNYLNALPLKKLKKYFQKISKLNPNCMKILQ